MMRIFVDTSAWFALNSRKDQHHKQAGNFVASLKSNPVLLITTDYVVDETLTLLRFKVSHREAVAFLRLFSRSPQIVREQVTPEHLKRAEAIFSRCHDKFWSFTDCVSFAFMEEKGLKDVFAFDENFSQFGMRIHPIPV
jgi:predicted nucleic acid-binding protein